MSEDSSQEKSPVINIVESKKIEKKMVVDAVVSEINSKIYVGPNIPQDGLNRFKVYQNGMPEHLANLFTACPTVNKLFVDVDDLSEVLNQIEQTGTAYHTWYAAVVDYIKGA